jgi:hypothetical protein
MVSAGIRRAPGIAVADVDRLRFKVPAAELHLPGDGLRECVVPAPFPPGSGEPLSSPCNTGFI